MTKSLLTILIIGIVGLVFFSGISQQVNAEIVLVGKITSCHTTGLKGTVCEIQNIYVEKKDRKGNPPPPPPPCIPSKYVHCGNPPPPPPRFNLDPSLTYIITYKYVGKIWTYTGTPSKLIKGGVIIDTNGNPSSKVIVISIVPFIAPPPPPPPPPHITPPPVVHSYGLKTICHTTWKGIFCQQYKIYY